MTMDDQGVERFDASAWECRVRQLGLESCNGTGQVYLLYQRKFRSLIGEALAALPVEHQAQATAIANAHGYSEPEEEVGDDDCAHGLDPNCCPLGCGDIDDGWPSEDGELPDDVV
ncbi:TPA: hypothetical protein ACKPYM_000801 [Stenotrophomonas maltophilia]